MAHGKYVTPAERKTIRKTAKELLQAGIPSNKLPMVLNIAKPERSYMTYYRICKAI